MDFSLSDVQSSWRARAGSLGRELPHGAPAPDVIMGAARQGLLDPAADPLAAVVAIEALASESTAAGIALALHSAVLLGMPDVAARAALVRGEIVGATALSSDEVPADSPSRLVGRASWVGPLTDRGLAIIGARREGDLVACAVHLDHPGVRMEAVGSAALDGFVVGHVTFDGAEALALGSPQPFMSFVRLFLAATGLGMGRRALREAMHAARGYSRTGAGGEQTVQGLLADAATELDAAMLLTWKAASAPVPSLAGASMAKLAVTEATQRAVARATQVVGADSFRRGHVVERLAQDVRALELFAGRTEALREAVAGEVLPRS